MPRHPSMSLMLCWLTTCLLALPAGVFAQGRATSLQKFHANAELTRLAFGETVSAARRSTVRILEGDRQVALGVIVGSEGLIATKASQVTRASQIEFHDGRRANFEVRFLYQSNDLAILNVTGTGMNANAAVLETASPSVGAWVATVGIQPAPIAIGVVSVGRRSISPSAEHGVLGIELELEQPDAAKIRRVFPNSGAEQAGLTAGDVVLEVDKQGIVSSQQLVKTLRKYRPGDTLTLRVLRDEQESSFNVTLTHPFGDFLTRMAFQNQMGGPLSFRRDDFEAAYQTDAVIKPEECGGPVVDLNGKVIGINIARAGRTETYVLPSDLILDALKRMQSNSTGDTVSGLQDPAGPALPTAD